MSTQTFNRANSQQASSRSQTISPAALAQHLTQSLKEDQQDLVAMEALLDAEKNALEHNESDKLEGFSKDRNQLTTKLDKRNAHRLSILQQAGLAAQNDSWKRVIENLAAQTNSPVFSLWQSVEQQLARCSEKIQVNEKIIANMRQNINQLINAIRGEIGGGETYNRDGKAKAYSSGKPFTRA